MYVVVPRRHLYWIEAVRSDGERRVIDCFRDEDAAVQRLRQLECAQQAMDHRGLECENSRWYVLGQMKVPAPQHRGRPRRANRDAVS